MRRGAKRRASRVRVVYFRDSFGYVGRGWEAGDVAFEREGPVGRLTCRLSPPVMKWPRREPVVWSSEVRACRLYGHGSLRVASCWQTGWMCEIWVAVMKATEEAPHGARSEHGSVDPA